MIRTVSAVLSSGANRKIYSSFLPPMTPEHRESLKRSIAKVGVQKAVIEDDVGGLIDGRYRDEISRELGVPCPREIRHFESEGEKYELALRLNCQRRQLNRKQKRELIAAYLRSDPEIADNTLANILGGVSKNTVSKVRCGLEATRLLDKLDRFRGKDGKVRPRKYARVIANTSKEVTIARQVVKALSPSCDGKILGVNAAVRHARRQQRKQEIESQIPVPLPDDAIRLYHCPFQQLEAVAGIVPGSVNAVITDTPYDKDFLSQLADLGAFAERILVDGGLFVMYSGQYYLDQVMTTLGQHLTYRWMLASVWDGAGTPLHPRNVVSKWKPILVYSKGNWQNRGMWVDLSHVPSKEKDWHPWQQPLQEVEMLVRYFSAQGDLIVDPCGGGFTTAVACQALGRCCVSCDVDKQAVAKGQQRLSEVAAVQALQPQEVQ